MKEDKSIFLKVDYVEPVYNVGPFSYSGEPYLKGIKVWIGSDGHFFDCDRFTVYDPDAVREDAYQQAFALLKEIYCMGGTERRCVFGKASFSEIVKDTTYDDLAKKLDAWKEEKETIRVRDEAYSQTYEVRFVITKIITPCDGDVTVNGLKKDGTAVKGLLLCNLKKTGLHVDDLDAYLEV